MTHRIIVLLITLSLGCFGMPLAADAPPRAILARIAFLGLTAAPPASALPPVVVALHHELPERG